ncbi:unnamed protein product [Sordaria macrospora k-hell]|uniref:WGS project CABT00000000 data, contig 2.16 n=1 Tax=Sordaria macrospora (strain ATCC MYA-333 / DSM 997 / K(L3346) / K-hell) TaxID=771870 RepID=F7W010_SORMK|nr:uncharacterized protein SMAC_03816 [Sordaria macrospora k-hell]CCC11109.1 unnamed protein product [Sordaria macrospora k-hell]
MSSLPQDGGHQPSGSLRDGKDVPAATNTAATTFETTPLLVSLGRQSSAYTDLNNTSTRDGNDPELGDSNGFCRVRHGHEHGADDLDEEADAARQVDHSRQEQRLNATPSPPPERKQHRLWNRISRRLIFLQRENDENERSPLEKDLVRSFLTFFSISYCLMLIPSQVIITYVRPSYWLPGLEIGWGFVTALIAFAQNANQIYALRVLLGLFESSAWPGMMTLFSQFSFSLFTIFLYSCPSQSPYPTPPLSDFIAAIELAKRMGFYHSCQALGSMMSGALQVAVLESLEGKWGLRGWRLVSVFLFTSPPFFLSRPFPLHLQSNYYPNSPNPRSLLSTSPRITSHTSFGWLSDKHVEVAEDRLKRHGRSDSKKITWPAAKRTFRMWIAYFIPMLYIASVLAPYGYNYFNLFLKELKREEDGRPRWSVKEVNTIPILGNGVNVVFVWIWAILSDLLQTRWTLLVAQGVIGLIPCIIMSVWTSHPDTTPVSAAYASYFMTYMSLGTAPLIMSWLSDIPERLAAKSRASRQGLLSSTETPDDGQLE